VGVIRWIVGGEFGLDRRQQLHDRVRELRGSRAEPALLASTIAERIGASVVASSARVADGTRRPARTLARMGGDGVPGSRVMGSAMSVADVSMAVSHVADDANGDAVADDDHQRTEELSPGPPSRPN